MAEVGAIIVNARLYHAEFSRGSKKMRDELGAINQSVQAGERSLKAFYQTQARAANRTGTEQRIRNETAAQIKAVREAALSKTVDVGVQQKLFGIGGTQMVEAAKEAGDTAGEAAGNATIGSFIDTMKKQMGKGSTVGKIASIVKGGGAIAGVALSAKLFEHVTEQILEASEAMHEVNTWWEKTWIGIKAVPIVGAVAKGVENLVTWLSGAAAAANELKKHLEEVAEVKKLIDESTEKSQDVLGSAEDRLRRAGMSETDKGFLDVKKQFDADFKAIDELDKKRAEVQAAIDKPGKADEKLVRQRDQLEADIEKARDLAEQNREAGMKLAFKAMHDEEEKLAQEAFEERMKELDELSRRQREIDEEADQRERDRVDDLLGELDRQMKDVNETAEQDAKKRMDTLDDQIKEREANNDKVGRPEGRERRFSFQAPVQTAVNDPVLAELKLQKKILQDQLDEQKKLNAGSTSLVVLDLDE